MKQRTVLWILVVIAFVGFLDAAFLTIQHVKGAPPPCSLLKGCEVVTTSMYAEIANIPVALMGAVYYLSIVCLAVYCLQTASERTLLLLQRATVIGLFASVYFVSLQVFVIHALCMYCIISAATSTALFGVSLVYLKKPNH